MPAARPPRLPLPLLWAAIFFFGWAVSVAEPWFVVPRAPSARAAFYALLALEAPDLAGLADLCIYLAVMLAIPLALLGALSILERHAGGVPRAGSSAAGWRVQLLFIPLTTAALMLVAHLRLRTEPLVDVGPYLHFLPQWLRSVLLFGAGLVLADLITYWLHRAQHRFAWLWRFHAVHHSHEVDALHNINHPLEAVMSIVLVGAVVGLVLRVPTVDLFLLSAFLVVQGRLNHMRGSVHLGPLGCIFVDNRFHLIHHSKDPADFNSNFAARFPFIDRIFGTYRPRRSGEILTGLDDRGPPATVLDHLLARWRPLSVTDLKQG